MRKKTKARFAKRPLCFGVFSKFYSKMILAIFGVLNLFKNYEIN
jgi:hypothetical protein